MKFFHLFLLTELKVTIKMMFDDCPILDICSTWPFCSHTYWSMSISVLFFQKKTFAFLFRCERWINKTLPFISLNFLSFYIKLKKVVMFKTVEDDEQVCRSSKALSGSYFCPLWILRPEIFWTIEKQEVSFTISEHP